MHLVRNIYQLYSSNSFSTRKNRLLPFYIKAIEAVVRLFTGCRPVVWVLGSGVKGHSLRINQNLTRVRQ